jgi:signal transduction histidine kinase
LRGASGELRWLETNKVPLRDLDGRVIGILGTFEDVTERKAAEQELQQTLAELDDRVQRRTAELMRANESLRREVEDRVRLQAEERQQRAYAEALRDTAAAMSDAFDLGQVTEEVLAGVERLVSNDLTAVVLVTDDGGYELLTHLPRFDYEPRELSSETTHDPASLSIVARLEEEPGPVILEDPDRAIGPARSVVGARIEVGDQLVGYLFAESATLGFFTEGHGDRLGAVADQAGTAISNSRLASRSSELAATEERQRLARELHDAVNQTLWTAALTAESVLDDVDEDSTLHHRVYRLRQLTRGALAEMRALLLELRPGELTEIGLDELIEQLLTALECRRTLDVDVELDAVQLEPASHLTFYRIAQEGIGNVAQHAEASSLSVRLTKGPPAELCITDDGGGFDPADVAAGHLGLTIMRERAESIGAHFSMESQPGSGAILRLRAGEP